MTKIQLTILSITTALSAFRPEAAAVEAAPRNETPAQHAQRMHWFREARFGMFIHWGLFSISAGEWDSKKVGGAGEWIMNEARIPVSDYEKLAPQFNPIQFDARKWVQVAKAAGVRYIVITTKHHDGFNMFDSKVGDYNIVNSTPFKSDPMKELAAACKEADITLCFYHSIMDWHHPDAQGLAYPNYNSPPHNPNFPRYVESYLKPEVKELLTNYGRVGIIWFDGEWITDWTGAMGKDMYAWCRSLQPGVIVNNRVGKDRLGAVGKSSGPDAAGDYATPEQQIPATGFGPGVDWESCMTMNSTWGYVKDDHDWKSTATIVRMLIDCSSKGGNFLLNIGPTPEGLIPEPSVKRLAEVGEWMKTNGEAIYGTSASPFRKLSFGKCTQKPGRLYLHVFDWPSDGKLLVPIRNRISNARLLMGRTKALQWTKSTDGVLIDAPKTAPDDIATVVMLEFKGKLEVLDVGITQSKDGTITLLAEDAELVGSQLQLETRGGKPNIGYLSDPGDHVRWSAQFNRPGEFEVELNYSCDPTSDGNEFVVDIAGQKLRGKVTATRDWEDFITVKLGSVRLEKSGPTKVSISPVGPSLRGGGLMNLRSLVLKPVGRSW